MKLKFNIHFVFVIAAASLWGISGLFVRTISKYNVSEMELVFWRAIISSFLLAVCIFLNDIKLFKIRIKDLWLFASAGLFSIVVFNYSYYTTMSLASLSVAAVLLYTAPFFVVIISLFLFKERLTINKTLACIIAFIGCCFVSGIFDSQQRISGKGLFFGLLTGFGYALYTIFGKILLDKGYKTLTITFYVFLSAAVCSIPFINVFKTVVSVCQTPKIAVTVFFMALLNTVIPYILYTIGLSGVEPSIAPIIATIEPVVATIIGFAFYSEAITLSTTVGIILVFVAVIMLNRKNISIKANAKINLTLDIVGKREDGYHFIDTVMQSVSLGDNISIYPYKKIKIKCNDKFLNSDDNIAYKAAKLFFEETKIKNGALIKIKKRIPKAAGLGGGSADAAAVIVGLDRLFETNLPKEKLIEMSMRLGADVPFFIEGGTVRAQGIGERLTKLENIKETYFILAKTENKPSTKEMYKKIDEKNTSTNYTEKLVSALKDNDSLKLGECLGNSFASVWNESDTEKKLNTLNSQSVSLSGSGPTWFAMFNDKAQAKKAFLNLKKQKINCYFVKSIPSSIIFE